MHSTSLVNPEPQLWGWKPIINEPASLEGKPFLPESWQEIFSLRMGGVSFLRHSDIDNKLACCPHYLTLRDPLSTVQAQPQSITGVPVPSLDPECCWHSWGPSSYQTVVLARRLQKCEHEKTARKGAWRAGPGPSHKSGRRWGGGYLRELPSAIQQPRRRAPCLPPSPTAMRACRWGAPSQGQEVDRPLRAPRSCSAPGCSCL